jgi:hypothetical protein
METIYAAGWQGWKVRFVTVICLAGSAGIAFAGWYLGTRYGLELVDGGVLKPLGTRLAIGAAFLAGAAAIAGGMWVYGRCYVQRVLAADDGSRLRIRLSGLLWGDWLDVPAGDVLTADFRAGQARGGGISVNAPWFKVRLRGRRLPLILDVQGDFVDEGRVYTLLLGEPAPVPFERSRIKPGAPKPVAARKKRRT